MADTPPHPGTGDDTGAEPHIGSTTGMPRWVKVFVIIAILALLFVILSLTGVIPGGPGGHGPGRH